MTDLNITHTHADGTLVEGDPRPHQQALKDAGFRYSRHVGWYLRASRDKPAQTARIDQAAQVLRAHGHTVTVTINDTTRSTADVEADRVDRNADRVEGLRAKADREADRADALFERARDMSSLIPTGQPILVGHHSERRDRNYRAKIARTHDRSIEANAAATDAQRRAQAAQANQARHESLPTTLRRIATLEADHRRVERTLAPCAGSGRRLKPTASRAEIQCPDCFHVVDVVDHAIVEHGHATGDRRTQLLASLDELADQLAFWHGHVADLTAAGAKVWGPDDFNRGDLAVTAHGRHEIVRVNKKSVTVRTPYSWTETITYDRIRGKVPATGA